MGCGDFDCGVSVGEYVVGDGVGVGEGRRRVVCGRDVELGRWLVGTNGSAEVVEGFLLEDVAGEK